MEAPETPRPSTRQQFPPVRVHRTLVSTSHTYKWPASPLHTRSAQPTDFLPEEADEPGVTNFYSSLIRYGPPSYGKKPPARAIVSGPIPNETFFVGDTVLVASGFKNNYIAVITALWRVVREGDEAGDDDDSGEFMRIGVHWFTRPEQLVLTKKHRSRLYNEIYYSTGNAMTILPQQIVRKCHVTSHVSGSRPRRLSLRSSKSVPEEEVIYGPDDFVCISACTPARLLFYEFSWELHRDHAKAAPPGDQSRWAVNVADIVPETPSQSKTRNAKKRGMDTDPDAESNPSLSTPSKRSKSSREVGKKEERSVQKKPRTKVVVQDEDFEPEPSESPTSSPPTEIESDAVEGSDIDFNDNVPRTPKRKRKARSPSQAATTPRHKRVRTLAMPTPRSKAALKARQKKSHLVVKPPPPEMNEEHYKQLKQLPKDPWLRAMHVLHVAARPNELPCREEEYGRVLRSVLELVEEGSSGCVYISGVPGTGKTATVHAVVRELKRMAESDETNPFTYVEINGLKIPEPHAAYNLLWETISGHDAVADGHQAISWKEALKRLTKHFSGGASAGPGDHACVVLMDELDQLMTTKQDVVYNFFNWPTLVNSKLIVLAVANTMDLPERVMTGRVRSRLGMIRINFQPYPTTQLETIVRARLDKSREGLSAKAAEVISKDGVRFASMKVSSISGDARRVLDICRRTVELVQSEKKTAGMREVKEVISAMQNSPTAGYLQDLSLHERIMLAAVLKCMKKEGVEEVAWGDVQHQHIIYTSILTGDDDPTRRPTFAELDGVLDSLVASRAMLIEDGTTAHRKPTCERKVVLNLEQIEVERVLSEIGGQMWKNALGVS